MQRVNTIHQKSFYSLCSSRMFFNILVCLCFLLSSRNTVLHAVDNQTSEETNLKIPVVYIMFGEMSSYLKCNIELASRNNPVILLSSSSSNVKWVEPSNIAPQAFRYDVIIENFAAYSKAADAFARVYKHFSRDHSKNRIEYELRCIQRWLILQDYMAAKSISTVFYGDCDTTVFTSMTEAWKSRNQCSAMISVETQWHDYHWASAGHNSFWTLEAVTDFCDFFKSIYEKPSTVAEVLEPKWRHHGSTVTDMSLLWLWWVAHKRELEAGWLTGRPFSTPDGRHKETRSAADNAFNLAKRLNLPSVNSKLNLCNVLDVYNHTLFDHMHGWMGCGKDFTLDLESGMGHPSCIGVSHHMGGVPRSVDPDSVAESGMESQRLYMLTLHYQGGMKSSLEYDVCRVLLLTADKQIVNHEVNDLCAKVIKSYTTPIPLYNRVIAGLPCANHSSYRGEESCF